jgi:ubiquinone/menaquinone biosynthesis C-methylase UbiE
MADDYKNLDGYYKDADLGLGCGVPTEFALMQEGHTVLDLGSGAGNDVFVARRQVGENGKVFGIDMTDEMIEKARQNAVKLGYDNVEFVKGEIENMPLNNNLVDVVISNCVLNLVPDKDKAFSEIYRVMKPGGHFSISDIVLKGFLPDNVKMVAEMYAGCISGALQMEDYIGIVEKTGFKNIKVQKSKKIQIEDEVLNKFMSKEEIDAYRSKEVGVLSITLYAEK